MASGITTESKATRPEYASSSHFHQPMSKGRRSPPLPDTETYPRRASSLRCSMSMTMVSSRMGMENAAACSTCSGYWKKETICVVARLMRAGIAISAGVP